MKGKKFGIWTLVIVAVLGMVIALMSPKVREWLSKIGIKQKD
jgi:hypothetical protein